MVVVSLHRRCLIPRGRHECRKGAGWCSLGRVSAWEASRAKENEAPFPQMSGNWVQFESWDCNPLPQTKRPISSPVSSSLLPLHILWPFFPAFFVLFPCLWGCRKTAAFLRLLFKDILRDAATAAPSATLAAAPVPDTGSEQPQCLLFV